MTTLFTTPSLTTDFRCGPTATVTGSSPSGTHGSKSPSNSILGAGVTTPKGSGPSRDPQTGWLARREAIMAGIDNVRVDLVNSDDIDLGTLMSRFLTHKRQKVKDGELSLTTLGDYLREVAAFVTFQKPGTPAGATAARTFHGIHAAPHRRPEAGPPCPQTGPCLRDGISALRSEKWLDAHAQHRRGLDNPSRRCATRCDRPEPGRENPTTRPEL